MTLYRQFSTQEELDWEYSPELRATDPKALDKVIATRLALSAQAKKELKREADLPYGPTLIEKLDVYPASMPRAPIVLFIHGGYWTEKRLRKENYIWIAKGLAGHDVTTAIIDYELCPKVTIDEIVRQCRAAIAWLYRNAEAVGGDPARLYVIGASAGGLLATMAAVTDWVGDYGLPADAVKGGCIISGLFDLEPFQYTWLQPKIQFSGQQIKRNSPILHVPENGAPLLVSWGANESAEFWRQSQTFADAWEKKGNRVQRHPQEECDHYTATSGLGESQSAFCLAVIEHMRSCWKS